MQLEEEFARYTRALHCVSMVNGTAAIRTALWVLGVGRNKNDEVICPSFTWWPTVTPVTGLGAQVVFAEIDPTTLTLDPADVVRRITTKTKAVIVVHPLGMPADLDGLTDVCGHHNLPIIEDCCLAPGARYRGRHVGTFGAFGCFSMQAGKALPAGEGGLLITNDQDLYERAVLCGHPKRIKTLSEPYRGYGGTPIGGVKNRLNSIAALIGIDSLRQLDNYTAQAATAARRLFNGMAHLPGLDLLRVEPHVRPIYHYPVVRYDALRTGVNCTRLLEALQAEGLTANRNADLQHHHRFFVEQGSDPHDLPITNACAEGIIWLPRLHNADDQLIDQCIEAFVKVWANLDKLKDQ